ncbi:MAG: hypothetical protein IJ365_02950 [Clostridia bacterium]|nr:hypothetical protein [Clostridia bacterium]
MTKKIFSLLLCVTFAVLSVSAVFAADTPMVAVSSAGGSKGDIVDVVVSLSGNSGFSSIGIQIGYDASVLKLTNATASSAVGATYTAAQTLDVNPYNMSWDSGSNVSYNGTLATLSFEILTDKAGEYAITVGHYRGRNGNYTDGYDVNYDENFESLGLGYTNGSITVTNSGDGDGSGDNGDKEIDENYPAVSVGTATGNSGETVELPLELSGNSGFSSLGIQIGYDASALKLTNVTANSAVGATYTGAQTLDVNPYNMSWDSGSNVSYNGTLATLTFEILTDAAGNYPVTVEYYKGRNGNYTDGYDVNYDENFESIGLQYKNGAVTVGAAQGVNVEIDLGSGIYAAKFDSSDYDGYIIAALYDSINKLIALKKCSADKSVQFTFDGVSDTAYVKLMWWGSTQNLRPLHKAQMISVTGL